MKEIKKEEVLQLLENLAKIDHKFVIVGSTVLKRNGLIKRESDDVDIVVTSESEMEELISFMIKALALEKAPGCAVECGDMYGNVWEEVRASFYINYGVDKKVDFIINSFLPEVDLENNVYCSKEAAVKHKVEKACLVKARQKDIEDACEILDPSDSNLLWKFNEFHKSREKVAHLGFNNPKSLYDYLGIKNQHLFFRVKNGYGESVAIETLELILASENFPKKVIDDLVYLVTHSGKIIEQLVW